MSANVPSQVELAYCEPADSYRLESHFFPSKVGGLPAWLSFSPLPADLVCEECKKPLCFLLQVYAPLKEPHCFHRTIFVFICRDPLCCKVNCAKNLRVVRSQLPRENKFYANVPVDVDSFDPEKDKESVKRVTDFHRVCAVCGAVAEKACGKCKDTNYCSKEHQEMDWKVHKSSCSDGQVAEAKERLNAFPFPENELVIDTEHFVVPRKEKERSEQERMEEYASFVKENQDSKKLACDDQDLTELEKLSKKTDKLFKAFRQRVEQNPDQVLRYQRSGSPLWATSLIPKDVEIPPCPCGSKRIFEFQIMPHLLSYLNVDAVKESIDWATVAIYTCSNSCASEQYMTEVAFKQDFMD